jgi:hypothetical protein
VDEESMNANWSRWYAGLVVIGLAAWAGRAQAAQASVALTSLTVPESSLPDSCRLRPYVPAMSPVAKVGTTTVMKSNFRSPVPFPANPWIGTEHKLIVDLRTRVDGALRFPDAPPPSTAELSSWEGRWVEHVVEGYHAVYDSADGFVDVAAIRFDDPSLATATAPVSSLLRSSSVRSDRLVIGPVVVRVAEGRKTNCFEAVLAYIRMLR